MRRKNANQWTIDVITSYTLFGKKTSTRRFDDYRDYQNDEIQIETMEGTAGEIDFNDPVALAKLDPAELEASVRLMSGHLERQIDAVWASDGLYSSYVEAEYARMGDKFSEYYADYREGITMADAAAWNMPVVDGGPSALTIAKVAGSMALSSAMGPMGAFLVNTMAAGINVADGTMAIQQAAFSIGMSAVTAGLAVGSEWLGDQVVGNALESGFMGNITQHGLTMTGNVGLAGFSLDENFSLHYSASHMKHWGTWGASGATASASFLTDSLNLDGRSLSSNLITGTGNYIHDGVKHGDWRRAAIDSSTGAAASYVASNLTYGLQEGTGLNKERRQPYTTALTSNIISGGVKRMFGQKDALDWNTITTIDTTAQLVNHYGDMLDVKEYHKRDRGRLSTFLNNLGGTVTNSIANIGGALGYAGRATFDAAGRGYQRFTNLARGTGFHTNEERAEIYERKIAELDPESPEYSRDKKALRLRYEDTTGILGSLFQRTGNLLTGDGFHTSAQVQAENVPQGQSYYRYLASHNYAGIHEVANDDDTVRSYIDTRAEKGRYDVMTFDAENQRATHTFTIRGRDVVSADEAQEYAGEVFGTLDDVTNAAGMQGGQKFRFFIDESREYYRNMKFGTQKDLNYNFGQVMTSLGQRFDANGDDPIPYGFATPFNETTGKTRETLEKADCTSFVSIGVHIMGFTQNGGYNITNKSTVYDYDPEYSEWDKKLKLSTNHVSMRLHDYTSIDVYEMAGDRKVVGPMVVAANTSIFETIPVPSDQIDDLTGMIGITNAHLGTRYVMDRFSLQDSDDPTFFANGGDRVRQVSGNYYNHGFVFTDAAGNFTVESTTGGIRAGEIKFSNLSNLSKVLQIRLTEDRSIRQ